MSPSSQLCVNAKLQTEPTPQPSRRGQLCHRQGIYGRKEAEFQNVQGLIKSTKMKFLFAFTLAASLAALVIAAPLDLSATGAQGDDMAELAALSALLSPQSASESDSQVDVASTVTQEDVQESAQTENQPMESVFHGGYTFFRVPFTSSTSSNEDILATCKSKGFLTPCDWAPEMSPCGGCDVIPIAAHPAQQSGYHFGYGGYNPNTYSWPGGYAGWEKFFLQPSSVHIFANAGGACTKSCTNSIQGIITWVCRCSARSISYYQISGWAA